MPLESNSSIEALRDWFRTCPILQPGYRFRADYLAETPTEYALYSSPSTIQYQENVLGEMVPARIQTLNFIFASRENFGADAKENIANLQFYETVTQWILEQNTLRNFPKWPDGAVRSIVPTLTAYPAEVGSDAAKYQIQIQVTYRRD